VPVNFLNTVAGTLSRKIMALHDPRIATALTRSDHINRFDVGQVVDLDFLANLVALYGTTQLLDETLGFAVSLGSHFTFGR
jgi:hypothetical protein